MAVSRFVHSSSRFQSFDVTVNLHVKNNFIQYYWYGPIKDSCVISDYTLSIRKAVSAIVLQSSHHDFLQCAIGLKGSIFMDNK